MKPQIALLTFCCACVGPSSEDPISALTHLETFPVDYSARISREGLAPAEGQAHMDDASDPEVHDGAAERQRIAIDQVSEDGDVSLPVGATFPAMIDSTFQLFEVPTDALTGIMPAFTSRCLGRVLANDQAVALKERLKTIQSESDHDLLPPRLCTVSGQAGTIKYLKETAYVDSYEMTFHESNPAALVADPVISIAREGINIEYTATIGTNGQLNLQVGLQLVDLASPIATIETTLPGAGLPVTTQIPSFTVQDIQAKTTVQPGQTLLLGPFPSVKEGKSLLVLITPSALPQSARNPNYGNPEARRRARSRQALASN